MILFSSLVSFCFFLILDGKHFNGGTINWAPINPYNNSTSVPITITQSYSWTYPYVSCANNVPISTSTFSGANRNLTCVVDCSTDGGYSTHPIDILTDCTSASTSLNKLSSTKSKNITLNAGAHFYLAYLGTAWVALNYPTQSGLEWSIVTFIDLRMRPDGFINTPPVATVVSPQYAFVNQTIQIQIPVSDANVGDDVRCRWSTYTTGYRRRKRYDMEAHTMHQSIGQHYASISANRERLAPRKKRSACFGCIITGCNAVCRNNCPCCCNDCDSSLCTGVSCNLSGGCGSGAATDSSTTTKSTTSTTTTETTTSTSVTRTTTTSATTDTTTTVEVTTTEMLGTLKSTSSYPVRQAINECGGICYPGSLPSSTTLSNCTITFTGLRAGVWYAVAVQVEDFINSASNIPLSSVPVQFLIYVMPQPACPKAPIILPVNGCLEVQVGVSVSFRLHALNLCNRTIANLTDIILSSGITGMSVSNLTTLSTNSSISYITLTWIPQASQVGFQEVCAVAFTSEKLRSNESCEIFTVKNSSDLCATTTTTSTSTTTQSTSSTSATTTTISTTSTSGTTSTTSETTTTSTTSTSTTSTTTSTTTTSTSTTSTSTSTSSTTTSTTTTSTSTTSTSTSTTSTTTSTTTTSTSTTSTSTSTTSTTTSTTTTSITTTSSTSVTTTTATTTTATTTPEAPKTPFNWLLILGLSLLALLLALCCACCCLYWLLWGPAARRRRKKRSTDDRDQQTILPRNKSDGARKRETKALTHQSSLLRTDPLLNNKPRSLESVMTHSPSAMRREFADSATVMTDVDSNRVSSTVSVRRLARSDIESMNNTQQLDKVESEDIRPVNDDERNIHSSISQHSAITVLRMNRLPNRAATAKRSSSVNRPKASGVVSAVPSKAVQVNVIKVSRKTTTIDQRPRAASVDDIDILSSNKTSIEMRPMGNRSAVSIFNTDGRATRNNRVTVTKMRRKPTVSPTHHN